jgi:hypothetical protein
VGTNAKGQKISPVHIDIFPFIEVVTDGRYRFVNADERFQEETPGCPQAHCNIQFWQAELFPLRRARFYNTEVAIPAEAEKVLARSLGADYMTVAKVRQGGDAPALTYELTDYSPA